MEWTRGIVAILLHAALLISPALCIVDTFKVINLRSEDVTSWGFKALWNAPVSNKVVDEYRMDLWSGEVKVETQVIDASIRQFVFEGLAENTDYTIVVWTVEYGSSEQSKTYSLPVLHEVKTLDTELSLDSRDDDSLTIGVPASNPAAQFNTIYVVYKDVRTGNSDKITRAKSNVPFIVSLNNLQNIAGSVKRGRLIEVSLHADSENGELIGIPARFRTLLDKPIGVSFSKKTGTSVDVRSTYISDVDTHETVVTCQDICSTEVTVPAINSVDVTVGGLVADTTYDVKVVVSAGEKHRPDPHRPTYVTTMSDPEELTLEKLNFRDGQEEPSNPEQLDVSWTWTESGDVSSIRLTAVDSQGRTFNAEDSPLEPPVSSAVILGLEPGTKYKVELSSLSDTNQVKQITSEEHYTPLLPVTGMIIEATQTSIKAVWDKPDMKIDFHFELTINPPPEASWSSVDGRWKTDKTEYVFRGLAPDTFYSIGVQTRAEDPNSPGSYLSRSNYVTMELSTGAVGLTVYEGYNSRSAQVTWNNPISAPINQFGVTLKTVFEESDLDAEIRPSITQTVPNDINRVSFEGLQPGIIYEVILREDSGDEQQLVTSMEFKFLINIFVTLREINSKTSELYFGPASGIAYDTYHIRATAMTNSDVCRDFADEFGPYWVQDRACSKHWLTKPASCVIEFDVAAYRTTGLERELVSATVTLTANNTNSEPYVLYEEQPTDTNLKVWWIVDNNPAFDYYYLTVTDNDNNTEYCTAIPRPDDTWLSAVIEDLRPGDCYSVLLEQWRYHEVGDANNYDLDNFDARIQLFTALGSGGAVSSLHILTQVENNLEIGWGRPENSTISFSGYVLCIEPTADPDSYEPIILDDTDQVHDLLDSVNRDQDRIYLVQVATFIAGEGKETQYSDEVSDFIDLDAPLRGALTVINVGTTFLEIEWHRDEEFLPTTSSFNITIYDETDQPVRNPFIIDSVTTTPITRTLNDLTPGTKYCITVEWLGTVPPLSRRVCKRTLPNRPGAVNVQKVGLTYMNIEWDEATGNKDFYVISAIDLDNGGDLLRKGRVESGENSFVVTDLIPDTTYRIEVVAASGTESDNAQSTPPRTAVETTSSIDPCNVIITGLSEYKIEVRWGPCPKANILQICPAPGPVQPGEEPFPATLDISDHDTDGERVYEFCGLRSSKKYSIFLKENEDRIHSTTKYTEPLQPTLNWVTSTPTSVTVSASANLAYSDDRHTIKYSIYDSDGELLDTAVTNGRDKYGQWVWAGLDPDTEYSCRATISVGFQEDLKTRSDPLEQGIPCNTVRLERNIIYVKSYQETSITLFWGELLGDGIYQIDISPPPVDSLTPYRFSIVEEDEREIGGLKEGSAYKVTLLQGGGIDPTEVYFFTTFTKPSSTTFVVTRADQTSITFLWQWNHDDEVIDGFAIGHSPVIPPRTVPEIVQFWERTHKLECLLPGQEVSVSLSTFIENNNLYYYSQPYVKLQTPTGLPTFSLQLACVCFTDKSFTIAWSDWFPPADEDFDGYVIHVADADKKILAEVKVPPEDDELFHHFYNLEEGEFSADNLIIEPGKFYLVSVSIGAAISASKAILTKPSPPGFFRIVPLEVIPSKTSLKVAWDVSTNVDYYKVFYSRYGYGEVSEVVVDPRKGDALEYTITGLDPQDPNVVVDLDNPKQRPAAYSVWVVAFYEPTFSPPQDLRKKRALFDDLNAEKFSVKSEPSVLEYKDGLTEPINPKEILAQVVETRSIEALFGASPDEAKPDGKYRFFIDTVEDTDPANSFEARGGSLDVADADFFFKYLFDNLLPGTVFTITLSVELKEEQNGETDVRNSVQVLTCPEPPLIIEKTGGDAVSLTLSWPKPFGGYTSFDVILEIADEEDRKVETKDTSVSFDNLSPDTEYTVSVKTVREWKEGNKNKKSKPESITIKTEDLLPLQIAVQDFGSDFINIVFGETVQDVVYEVSIDPGNCPYGTLEFGDYCYYIDHTARVDYSEAQGRCIGELGKLASILTEEEQEFIAGCTENDLRTPEFGFWIGLNDRGNEGTYEWTDGTEFEYNNWGPLEPNNDDDSVDCTTVWQTPNNFWGNIDCNTKQAFICKIQKLNPDVSYPVKQTASAAHKFTNLTPGRCYTITVDADQYDAKTQLQRTEPPAIFGLYPSATPTSIEVLWGAPGGVHDGYYVSYGPKDSGEDLREYPIRLLPGTSVVLLKDLLPNTEYTINVRTASSYGECDEYLSDPAVRDIFTTSLPEDIAYITDVDINSITIEWGTPSYADRLIAVRISLCPDSCDDPVELNLENTRHAFPNLVPGREYAIIFSTSYLFTDIAFNGPEQLLLQRTLPLPVNSFNAKWVASAMEFTWDPPAAGEFDQYAMSYSIYNPHRPEFTVVSYEVFAAKTLGYRLRVQPESIVYATLQARSQVECATRQADSAFLSINGVVAHLQPLEIFIAKRSLDTLLVKWGRVDDANEETPLYTLSWFGEADELDRKEQVTKNNEWMIRGLSPGKSYYINVEYNNLESPNKKRFLTAIHPPGEIVVDSITATKAQLTWPEDVTGLTTKYVVKYGPQGCAKTEPIILENFDEISVLLNKLDPSTFYDVEVYAGVGNYQSLEPSFTSFTTSNIAFGECEVVDVYPTSLIAVWDSVTNPIPEPEGRESYEVYKYKRSIRIAETKEIHGEEEFKPSDHPYVKFDNLWPGRQYEVCCEVYQINREGGDKRGETCNPQVLAPEPPVELIVDNEHHRGFCVSWSGPFTNFDNYVIKVVDANGTAVYPSEEEADFPELDPVYKAFLPDEKRKCVNSLFPGVNYTVVIRTWVDGVPEPVFSDSSEIEAITVSLDPLHILVVEKEKDSLTIEWGAIEDVENPEYVVSWSEEGTDDKETFATNELRHTLDSLKAGTAYDVTVKYGKVESPDSDAIYTVPCSPENLSAADPRSATKFSLMWSPPSEGGYEAFRISYIIKKDPVEEIRGQEEEEIKTPAGVVDKDSTSFTVNGLYVDTEYTFCVETIVGWKRVPGETVSEPESITDLTLGLEPLAIEISEQGTNYILVGWGGIDNPDPTTEKQYVITAETEGGSTAAIDTVPVDEGTVSRLGPLNSGIKYIIQIKIGERKSDDVWAYSLPESPGDIFLSRATSSTLEIGWGPADNFVGEYEVTFSPETESEQPIRTDPQTRRLSLEDLDPDTEYEFTIVNTVGENNLTTDSEPAQATFKTRNARLSVVGEPTTTTVTVQWTQEVGEFDKYILRLIDTEGQSNKDVRKDALDEALTEEEVTNLIPGSLYRLELYTVSGADEPQLSDIATTHTNPNPPGNLQLASKTYSSLTVRWDPPSEGRWDGFEVTYNYTAQDGGDDNDAIGRTSSPTNVLENTVTLEGLLSDIEYLVSVRAFRRIGKLYITSEEIENDYSTLEAPEGSLIVRTVSETEIAVRWTNISGVNDGYNLQLLNINSNEVVTFPDPFFDNKALFEDLVSGAVYDIQLNAIGVDGGDRQFQATIPPMVSSLSRIQRSIDSITLGWDAFGGGNDGEATGFTISYYPKPESAPPFEVVPNPKEADAEITFTLENLQTNQEYDFTIVTFTEFTGNDRVVRQERSDAFKYSVSTYYLNPAQIQILNVGQDVVCFKWGGTDSGSSTAYELRVGNVNNETDYTVQNMPINTDVLQSCFGDLHPGTLYDLTVTVGGTLEAGIERFRTGARRPRNLREVISHQCSITIAWDPSEGQADAYRLYYRQHGLGKELALVDVIYSSEPLEYTLDDLESNTRYEFQVEAVAGGELQEVSDANAILVSTGAELLRVEQDGNTLTVSWDPVADNFINYELFHSPSDGDQASSVFVPKTDQRKVSLTSLTEGQKYTLGLNMVALTGGRDLISRTCFTLRPPGIPNQSIQVNRVEDQAQSIDISINPKGLNDAKIDNVRILATPGTPGAGAGNPAEKGFIIPFEACPEIRLTGLCSDTYYVITLFTMSGNTLSEPVVTAVQTPPSSPGQLSFGAYTPTSIEVFWEAAAVDLEEYTLRISYQTPTGQTQVKKQVDVRASEPRNYVFTELTPGTLYTATVSAKGGGSYFDRKSQRTRPIILLGNFVATNVEHDSVTVTWPAAIDVDGYQICYFDVNDGVSRSYDVDKLFTESTIENLLPGTRYLFSVASYKGETADRSTSKKLTLTVETDEDPTVPPPTNLFVRNNGPHDVTVQWDKPSRDNYGHFLIEYLPNDVGHPASPILLPGKQLSVDISNLVSDHDYQFVVYAVDGIPGPGEQRSTPVTAQTTTDSIPFFIETLQVTDTRIVITWGPYLLIDVPDYVVNLDPVEGFVDNAITRGTLATLNSLQPDTTYDITVSARNILGEIVNTVSKSVKTLRLPVRSLTAKSVTRNSAFVYWPPAIDHSSTNGETVDDSVVAYRLILRSYTDYRGSGALIKEELVTLSACPRAKIRILYPGLKYYVSVIGVDRNGNDVTAPASTIVETLPPVPLDLHATHVDTNSIEVAWSEAAGDFSNYILQYNPPGAPDLFYLFSKADERKMVLERLIPGHSYTIQLTAQSATNNVHSSTTIHQSTISNSVNNLRFSQVTDTSFNAAWTPDAIVHNDYSTLCIFPDSQDVGVVVEDGTNTDFVGLAPGTNYFVTVYNQEEDEFGNIERSEPVSSFQQTTAGNPGLPVVVDYDETSVQINWVRVEGANRYFVRRTKVDGTDLAMDTVLAADFGLRVGYTFEDLVPGYEYVLYVRPDAAQFKEASTRQRTKPLAPLFVRTEFNADRPSERIITWRPPGLGQVDRYDLSYTPGNGSPPPPIYVNAGQPLTQTITGLHPDQTYVFFVTSEAGVTEQDIRTRSEPAIADIDVVARLAVEDYGHYFIDVAWPVLPGEFDSYVISYEPYDEFKPNVRPSPVVFGRQFGVTTINIYGLVPGEEYTIFLQTKTGQTLSPKIHQVMQTTVPLDVEEIRVDLVTASAFRFIWDDAPGVKDRYQVFFEPVTDVNNPAPALGDIERETFHPATDGLTLVQVSDLEAAQEYKITVVTWSNDEKSNGFTVIGATRPLPPTFIDVLRTTSSTAEVQWFKSESGSLGISKYQIEVIPTDNTRPIVIEATRNTQLIPGLTAGRSYQALIQSIAIDSKGEFLTSLPVSVAFVMVPLPPRFKSDPDVSSNTITVRWESGGGDLTRYSMEYSSVPDNPSVLSPIVVQPYSFNLLQLTINGLSPSTPYTFTIKAITSVTVTDSQSGSFEVIKESQVNSVIYVTLPNAVPEFYVTGTTATTIGLAWAAPAGQVDNYRIQVRSDNNRYPIINVRPTGPLEYLLSGLSPDTQYTFEIINVAERQESSPKSTGAKTNEDFSDPPGDLTAEKLSPTSIKVEWAPPEQVNGVLQGYALVMTDRNLANTDEIRNEEIELPVDALSYEFGNLKVGHEYTFSITASNNLGPGESNLLGKFIQLPQTAPPTTTSVPYRTPNTGAKDPYSISVTFRSDFFRTSYGPILHYSILVAEEPNPRESSSLIGAVGDPPPAYQSIKDLNVWPGYQTTPQGYNPFVPDRVLKRQVPQGPILQEDFVVGADDDCPDISVRYCNGRLRPYSHYRVSIRAYGVDGTYTDTPWSEPIPTGFNVLWFVYGVVAMIGFLMLIFLIILCVCCQGCGRPGEMDFFEDSEEDKKNLMMKSFNNGTPPMEYRHPHARSVQYSSGYRPPMYRPPSKKTHPSPEKTRPPPEKTRPVPKRFTSKPVPNNAQPHQPQPQPQPQPESNIYTDTKREPQPVQQVYAPSASQWSKPIFIGQFDEHMEKMNSEGGIRWTEELNKLTDVGSNFATSAAKSALDKNRYRNILPYDNNRVLLNDSADGSDYINASYVDGHHGKNEYLVTQGPLPNTIQDFWEMIWENEIPTIIMNTNLVENGRVKCEQYWPDSGEAHYGCITVRLISESDTPDWTMRTFELYKDDVYKCPVRIYHFRNWPDQGAPNDPHAVLKFLRAVRLQHPRRTGPGIAVHCSAGVGRSGTFTTIDILLQQLATVQSDTIDIFGLVTKLRNQRRYMVQSEEQYKFVHRAIQLVIKQQESTDSALEGDNWALGPASSTADPTEYTNAGMDYEDDL